MKNIYKKVYPIIIGMMLIAMPVFVFAQGAPPEEPVVEPEGVEAVEESGEAVEDLPDTAAGPAIDAGEPEATEVLPELFEAPGSEEVEITPLSEAKPPGITVHVEQLNWNTFKFRPSSQLGAKANTYSWDFGDGETSNQRIVEHSFSRPGTFHVSVKMVGADLQTRDAVTQIHIGFFYLANWRLWILLLLLAAIIIVASAVTGMANGKAKSALRPSKIKSAEKEPLEKDDEIALDTLSDETGDLDSMAATGLDTDELSEELALLESLDNTAEDISDDEPGIGELLEDVSKEVEAKTAGAEDTLDVDESAMDVPIDEEKLDKGLDELMGGIEEKLEIPKKSEKKAAKKKTKAKKKKSTKKRKKKK